MTVVAMANATSRVNEIQARLHQIKPSHRTFASALQNAEESAASAPNKTFVVTPQRLNDSEAPIGRHYVPIGMMGTPVMLRPGATIVSGSSATAGSWPAALPPVGQTWAPAIEQAAADAGLDPRLLAAMVWQESGFQPDAVSSSGALGLTQLMPATAAGLGVDPGNPIENLVGGARYLAWTIREFGSVELGLAAYNAGPGTVREAGGIPDIPETQSYVPGVLNYYRRLGGSA